MSRELSARTNRKTVRIRNMMRPTAAAGRRRGRIRLLTDRNLTPERRKAAILSSSTAATASSTPMSVISERKSLSKCNNSSHANKSRRIRCYLLHSFLSYTTTFLLFISLLIQNAEAAIWGVIYAGESKHYQSVACSL
jgi:hypothetical protein